MTELEALKQRVADLEETVRVLAAQPRIAYTPALGIHLDPRATKAQREAAAADLNGRLGA